MIDFRSGYNANGKISSIYRKLFLLSPFSVRAETPPNDVTRGKVLVGGGTGFVGQEVCQQLRRKGYEVVVISRTEGIGVTWKEVENTGLPVGTKAVVNVSGHNILDKFKRWNHEFKKTVYSSRILPAKILKKAIEKTTEKDCPKCFVQISGAGYYPFDVTEVYNEDYVAPSGPYFTNLVRDWEEAATLKPDHPTRNVFVRAGVVLGRTGGLIKEIFPPFFLGLGGRMGSGTQYMPWIHVKDVAGIIVHAVENDNIRGVLNGVAPEIITNQQFVDAFAGALGRPAFIPLPDFVFILMFGAERAKIVLDGQKVEPKRTLETGYKFRYPTIQSACKEFDSFFYSDPDQPHVLM